MLQGPQFLTKKQEVSWISRDENEQFGDSSVLKTSRQRRQVYAQSCCREGFKTCLPDSARSVTVLIT